MKSHDPATSIRRSVFLPSALVERAKAVAPVELHDNFNRLVQAALEEYIRTREEEALEESLALMVRDPAVRYVCGSINEDFAAAEEDGLGDEP